MYWALGLFVVGSLFAKGAVVSDTALVVRMVIGAALGFAIGSFLDWYDVRRK